MAMIGTTYREAKALRMYLEKAIPSERQVRELVAREREAWRRRMDQERQEAERRVAAGAKATGAVIDEIQIGVDRPMWGGDR